MAYEKQFWEQPHHDSSEEERLEREVKRLSLNLSTMYSKVKDKIEFLEGEIKWMKNVRMTDQLGRKRIYEELIEFLKLLLPTESK